MDYASERHVAQLHRIARTNRCRRTGHQLIARGDAARGDDVTALAVAIFQQRDVRGAVRVVLDALDRRRNTVFVALEIDQSIMLLVTAALVARGDAAGVVATAFLVLA